MPAHPVVADFLAGIEGMLDRRDVLRLAQRAGITPDPWQLRVLRSEAPTLLINCSRQAGKSTTVALLITAALLRGDEMVLILAPSERQSKELMRKVLNFWRRIGRPIPHVSVGKTSLELVNGSRLEALPGNADTVRGFTPTLLVIDEAAMADDTLFAALSPMLAVSGGRLVALSTPHGKRGWWYNLWLLPPAEDETIERVEIDATQCPRISPAFLARELRRIGKHLYDQEYMCKFLDDERQAFGSDDIAAAQVPGLETWDWALGGMV